MSRPPDPPASGAPAGLVAAHEGGHLLISLRLGLPVTRAEIRPSPHGGWTGDVFYDGGIVAPELWALAAVSGRIATEHLSDATPTHWSRDYREVRLALPAAEIPRVEARARAFFRQPGNQFCLDALAKLLLARKVVTGGVAALHLRQAEARWRERGGKVTGSV